eukprot:3354617-Pyramimonas_sp.AAC.1
MPHSPSNQAWRLRCIESFAFVLKCSVFNFTIDLFTGTSSSRVDAGKQIGIDTTNAASPSGLLGPEGFFLE